MGTKKSSRRSSPMADMIRESREELNNGALDGFPDDPRLGDSEELSGPERFSTTQKRRDEVVIDSMLSDISGKDGYFMKLKKEVRPNEYMLMKTIEEEWRRWADMEVAVADIVKEHTKIAPQKWGTGSYRVEIACKGGMRGKGYTPRDFYINAEEELSVPTVSGVGVPGAAVAVIDPSTAVASKLEELNSLVSMISQIMPKPQDPTQVQSQMAQAFQQGMALKASDSSNQTQMMTTMMTGLIGMMTAMMTKNSEPAKVVNPEETMTKTLSVLKDFGVLGGKQETPKEKSIVDFATELKVLGIDLFKKDDPMDQITRLKQMAGIASQFMGMGGEGEKPSILEKIIDVVGPAIPGMIKDIKETAEKAVTVQQLAGQNMQRAMLPPTQQPVSTQQTTQPSGEPTTYQRMAGGNEDVPPQGGQQIVNEQVRAFFNNLYESVKMNNKMFYPVVYTSLIQDAQGMALVQGVVNGTQNAQNIIDMLQQYGDDRFKNSEFVMKHLVGYVNGFMMWVRQMAGQGQPNIQPVPTQQTQTHATGGEFDVKCNVCNTVFSFASEAEWLVEQDRTCGEANCTGMIEPIKVAS